MEISGCAQGYAPALSLEEGVKRRRGDGGVGKEGSQWFS